MTRTSQATRIPASGKDEDDVPIAAAGPPATSRTRDARAALALPLAAEVEEDDG